MTPKKFAVLLCTAIIAGCAAAPKYNPPADPFDHANSLYQGIRPYIEEIRDKTCASSTISSFTPSEFAIFQPANNTLRALSRDGHIPAMFLWAELNYCLASQFLAPCLNGSPLGQDVKMRAKRSGLEVAEFCEVVVKRTESALKVIQYAAEFGYPPAQRKLEAFGRPLPIVHRKTKGQIKADLEFELEYQEYQEDRQAWRQAIAGAFANAGSELAKLPQPPTAAQSSTSLGAQMYRGCTVDSECILPNRCVRSGDSFQGVCATPVDDTGLPTYDLNEVRAVECVFDTDCSVGFRCLKRRGALEGICVK
jgi:hypothetical protein